MHFEGSWETLIIFENSGEGWLAAGERIISSPATVICIRLYIVIDTASNTRLGSIMSRHSKKEKAMQRRLGGMPSGSGGTAENYEEPR